MLNRTLQIITTVMSVLAVAVSIYVARQVNVVHVSINSRMSELLELTQEASEAKGLKQGRDEFRPRPK